MPLRPVAVVGEAPSGKPGGVVDGVRAGLPKLLLAEVGIGPLTGALEGGFHSHVEAAREAGFGGHGTQGGGCGCG